MARFLDALQIAPDEKTVVAIVRDYLSQLNPRLVELLPAECQHALRGTMDLQSAAVTLFRAGLPSHGNPRAAQFLHEIAHTFATASVRVSRFRAELRIPAF